MPTKPRTASGIVVDKLKVPGPIVVPSAEELADDLEKDRKSVV